jgi:hypothetical protein
LHGRTFDVVQVAQSDVTGESGRDPHTSGVI